MGEFRETVFELLGPMPEPCDLIPEEEPTEIVGDILRRRVSYQTEPGERIPAYLFLPKSPLTDSQFPAVLAIHQHASQYQLGKSEVAGLAGNPDQAYALELAERGYVVLAPDMLCFEERQSPAETLQGMYGEKFEFTKRILEGSCLQTKYLWDMRIGLDYLQSLPEVDPERLGVIGHSLGGQEALFLAAMDERIRAAVSSCGFSSFEAIFDINRNQNFALYVPKFLQYGDMGDLLAEVCPRPFLALAGENDSVYPIQGVYNSLDKAAQTYARHQAGDKLALHTFPVGHEFSASMREVAYKFFDQNL